MSVLLNQAYSLHQQQQFEQAENLYRQLLASKPNQSDALHLLGLLCYQTNRTADAIEYLQTAVALNPKHADYLHNYGRALDDAGQYIEAINHYQKALSLTPKDLDLQVNIGNAYLQLGLFEEAAGYYRRVVRIKSLNIAAKKMVLNALCHAIEKLGNHAQTIGHYEQAEACYQEALQYNPHNAIYYYNLGNAQRELGKAALAAESYTQSIKLNDQDADAYNNLGNVQRELGMLDKSMISYSQALALNPNLHHAKVHLVHQKQHICDWDNLKQSIDEIRQWVKHVPSAQISPFAFLAMPGTTAQEQQQCAVNWVNNRFKSLLKLQHTLHFSEQLSAKNKPSRKVKLGYFSADFRLHPLAFLVSELIELHDRSQFEVIAYSYGPNDKTHARHRLEKAFDVFNEVRDLSEIDLAKKINADGIDILIDLTGFTQNSRSGVLALRPAPVQVNWLGFPGTMGADFYDYLLSDGFLTPTITHANTASNYTEKLALLPHCYQPNDRKRPIGKLTTRADNQLPEKCFVFCCFNQSFKITPDIFAVWMRLLHATPNSVLWLLDCNSWAKRNLIKAALAQNIDAKRLIFAPRISIEDHLARHPCADLFLDTLPYNAHTTASDALWMGLPLLTCVGETFASRVAGSILKAAELPELITYSLAEYEAKATELSNNPDALKPIKDKLLSQVKDSPLFDSEKFTRDLEATLLKILYAG